MKIKNNLLAAIAFGAAAQLAVANTPEVVQGNVKNIYNTIAARTQPRVDTACVWHDGEKMTEVTSVVRIESVDATVDQDTLQAKLTYTNFKDGSKVEMADVLPCDWNSELGLFYTGVRNMGLTEHHDANVSFFQTRAIDCKRTQDFDNDGNLRETRWNCLYGFQHPQF